MQFIIPRDIFLVVCIFVSCPNQPEFYPTFFQFSSWTPFHVLHANPGNLERLLAGQTCLIVKRISVLITTVFLNIIHDRDKFSAKTVESATGLFHFQNDRHDQPVLALGKHLACQQALLFGGSEARRAPLALTALA